MRCFEVTDDAGKVYYFAVEDRRAAKRLMLLSHTKKIHEIDVNTYFLRVREKEDRGDEVVYRQIRKKKRHSSANHI